MIVATVSSDTFASGEGFTIRSPSPVIGLCRALLAAGYASSLPMEVYRNDVLALKVRSIGEVATLEIHGSRFMRPKGHTGGPPVNLAALSSIAA